MAPVIDCDCGHQVRADSDEGLVAAARQHIRGAHPDLSMTDDQIREIIRERARTV